MPFFGGLAICDAIADGALLRVLPEWEVVPGRMSLVWPARQPVARRVRVLMDFLCELWGDAPWDKDFFS